MAGIPQETLLAELDWNDTMEAIHRLEQQPLEQEPENPAHLPGQGQNFRLYRYQGAAGAVLRLTCTVVQVSLNLGLEPYVDQCL